MPKGLNRWHHCQNGCDLCPSGRTLTRSHRSKSCEMQRRRTCRPSTGSGQQKRHMSRTSGTSSGRWISFSGRLGITGTASMHVSHWRSICNIPQLPLRRVALSLLGSDMDADILGSGLNRPMRRRHWIPSADHDNGVEAPKTLMQKMWRAGAGVLLVQR